MVAVQALQLRILWEADSGVYLGQQFNKNIMVYRRFIETGADVYAQAARSSLYISVLVARKLKHYKVILNSL